MTRVEKGNVVLDIKDSEVQRYLDLGYNVVDKDGKIIQRCIPTDIGTLRKCYIEHTKRIEELETLVGTLQSQLKESKKAPKTVSVKK